MPRAELSNRLSGDHHRVPCHVTNRIESHLARPLFPACNRRRPQPLVLGVCLEPACLLGQRDRKRVFDTTGQPPADAVAFVMYTAVQENEVKVMYIHVHPPVVFAGRDRWRMRHVNRRERFRALLTGLYG